MARIKMSPTILREIDGLKMMQTINSNSPSFLHYTIFRRRHPTPEEVEEQWRKECRLFKEMLLEYQARIEASIAQSQEDQ